MEKLKRYMIFLIGLFINSLGVSLITKADLGTSPISAVPYVLSLNFPMTLGEFTILFSLLLIVIQLFILRRNFKLEHFLQVPISVLFGYFIDLTMALLGFVDPEVYSVKILCLLIGCLVLGFGVYLEVLADVAMLPGESFVRAIAFTWRTEFGITKVSFDVSLSVLAGALSFLFAGRLQGVREGTIIAAFLVGFIARLFGRLLAPVKSFLFPQQTAESGVAEDGATPGGRVIVIGRQYGSGGHEIGEHLAKRLGFAFYDNEIIQMAAGSTGYTPEYVREREENMTNSLLYDLTSQMYVYSPKREAPRDEIFQSEAKVIRGLADKGNCVIIGRCADFVLRDRKDCLKVYLQASLPFRVRRIERTEHLDGEAAEQKIRRMDRRRADNYHYYTNRPWGQAKNYDLTVSTELGMSAVEDLIAGALEAKTVS